MVGEFEARRPIGVVIGDFAFARPAKSLRKFLGGFRPTPTEAPADKSPYLHPQRWGNSQPILNLLQNLSLIAPEKYGLLARGSCSLA